ncbi:MAG: hypothetical protein NUV53_00440 [Patescibacteria group bacterium]|nr:hypothetical protein [Patescibacteria group bacterium]
MTTTTPWEEDSNTLAVSEPPRHSKVLKVVVVTIFLMIAGGGIYAYFLSQRPTGVNVSVEFVTPPQTLLGESFPLILSAANHSDSVLHDAKLSILLPEDVYFVGEYSGERIHDEVLGTIGPGSVTQRVVNIVILGQAQSIRLIEGKLAYKTSDDGRVQFEQGARANVQVSDPALQLSFETPKQVVNGETFTTKIHYKNESKQEFNNVKLVFRSPSIFSFQRATLEVSARTNDVWNLGTLKGGSEGDLEIDGKIVSLEGSFFTLSAEMSADFLGKSRELAVQTVSLGIATSPLSISIVANDASDYIAKIGSSFSYRMTVRNNSDIVFRGLKISAHLIGNLFNYGSVRSTGSFNSLANTLTWITANQGDLENIAPGETRAVNFTILLKDSFPIKSATDKNYEVRVEAHVESPTVPPDTAADKTIAVTDVTTKVAGAVVLRALALWRDAAWGILNDGPYPPRVNQPTQYSIHWRIANYATDIGAVHVEAFLQSGARFVGNAKSNVATVPQYDVSTGLVTWDIPSIAATKGVASVPVEGVFQIEATPATTHIGQSMVLMKDSSLKAKDLFTGIELQSDAGAVDSNIPEDATVTVVERRVVP